MGWRKFVIDNTLEFNKDFLKDLLKIKDDIEFSPWNEENRTEDEILEELKGWLFNEDHMEWLGQWLYEKKARKIIKKHKLTGHVIFSEDGDFVGNSGFKFVDGELVSTTLRLQFVDGEVNEL